jgi:hypothetical protein
LSSGYQQASTTLAHTTSGHTSTAVGQSRHISPGRTSRASSSGRSASLNPAAASSWRGHSEDGESQRSRSESPDLSTTARSTRTPEQLKGEREFSYMSPTTGISSEPDESTSVTATPIDLVADVDSILCTSFWAS